MERKHSPKHKSSTPRRHSSRTPSKRRSSPGGKAAKDRVPIRYIQVGTETKSETRDDDECEVNLLVTLIEKRDWSSAEAHIETQKGIEEAALQLSSRDYPLHVLCKCGFDHSLVKSEVNRALVSSGSGTDTSGTITTESLCGSSSFPPDSLVKELINAHSKAAQSPGAGGAFPLHSAVRNKFPAEHLLLLILAYPQALDLRDGGMRTPRDYIPVMDDVNARSYLLRPTSCWLQQIHDEKIRDEVDSELRSLTAEVDTLLDSLAESKSAEAELVRKVESLENEVETFGDSSRLHEFAARAEKIQENILQDADIIRGKLEGLAAQLSIKYADEEKERAYLASFNDDVVRIYGDANEGIAELHLELAKASVSLERTCEPH